MARKKQRVVLDTNILVSAIFYGGKPKQILQLVLAKQIEAVISPFILAELSDVLKRKFKLSEIEAASIITKLRRSFAITHPKKPVNILKDNPDNRILEAALTGEVDYIITGDKHLLQLKKYEAVRLVQPSQFLKILI